MASCFLARAVRLVTLSCGLTACGGSVDCPDDIESHRAAAVPLAESLGVEDVLHRMQIYCGTQAELADYRACGRSPALDIEACTLWLGGPTEPGRVYVAIDVEEDLTTLLQHEAGHWAVWDLPDACADHRPECWPEQAPY